MPRRDSSGQCAVLYCGRFRGRVNDVACNVACTAGYRAKSQVACCSYASLPRKGHKINIQHSTICSSSSSAQICCFFSVSVLDSKCCNCPAVLTICRPKWPAEKNVAHKSSSSVSQSWRRGGGEVERNVKEVGRERTAHRGELDGCSCSFICKYCHISFYRLYIKLH